MLWLEQNGRAVRESGHTPRCCKDIAGRGGARRLMRQQMREGPRRFGAVRAGQMRVLLLLRTRGFVQLGAGRCRGGERGTYAVIIRGSHQPFGRRRSLVVACSHDAASSRTPASKAWPFIRSDETTILLGLRVACARCAVSFQLPGAATNRRRCRA
jgi:hypothetical protein